MHILIQMRAGRFNVPMRHQSTSFLMSLSLFLFYFFPSLILQAILCNPVMLHS
jgi:hypothetical protein